MVSKVIYPRSTSKNQKLACGSYVKLQQLHSSSVFPVYLAIGRFVVDNETAARTIMTMITGVDSAAFDGVMISKRAHATIGARADLTDRVRGTYQKNQR